MLQLIGSSVQHCGLVGPGPVVHPHGPHGPQEERPPAQCSPRPAARLALQGPRGYGCRAWLLPAPLTAHGPRDRLSPALPSRFKWRRIRKRSLELYVFMKRARSPALVGHMLYESYGQTSEARPSEPLTRALDEQSDLQPLPLTGSV
ncbi:hypothetical protein SKAU_G00113160 [Synaphobranchus kaupii]|uniref:Uncharacterized protein n=1 Tax=Synaphobranchus kaupii TaxID=118154 RepID=A0A9Q1G0R2_SYNKA|nr:hypothetical protein SKAU_G00113160 [Synaphobranchus kaupii]